MNDVSQEELQSVPSASEVKQDILPPLERAVKTNEAGTETSKLMKNNLTEDKDLELMDVHEEGTRTEGKELRESNALLTEGMKAFKITFVSLL